MTPLPEEDKDALKLLHELVVAWEGGGELLSSWLGDDEQFPTSSRPFLRRDNASSELTNETSSPGIPKWITSTLFVFRLFVVRPSGCVGMLHYFSLPRRYSKIGLACPTALRKSLPCSLTLWKKPRKRLRDAAPSAGNVNFPLATPEGIIAGTTITGAAALAVLSLSKPRKCRVCYGAGFYPCRKCHGRAKVGLVCNAVCCKCGRAAQ